MENFKSFEGKFIPNETLNPGPSPSTISGILNIKICELEQENTKLREELSELKENVTSIAKFLNQVLAYRYLAQAEEAEPPLNEMDIEPSISFPVENSPQQKSTRITKTPSPEKPEIPSTSKNEQQQAQFTTTNKPQVQSKIDNYFNGSSGLRKSSACAEKSNEPSIASPAKPEESPNTSSAKSISSSSASTPAKFENAQKPKNSRSTSSGTPETHVTLSANGTSPINAENSAKTPPKRKFEKDSEVASTSSISKKSKHDSSVPIKKRIGPKSFLEAQKRKSTPTSNPEAQADDTSSISNSQRSTASTSSFSEEEDSTPCDVCYFPYPGLKNEMIYCEGCNVCVHQSCYGVLNIPDGEWKCQTCVANIPKGEATCYFCPNKGGAMIRVSAPSASGKVSWAHVSCVWRIPELKVRNPEEMDIVIGLANVDQKRWNLKCYLCKEGQGTTCCIQCKGRKCKKAFHVSCGFIHGLKMEMIDCDDEFSPHCKKHSYLAVQYEFVFQSKT